jgi:rhamnopyranosyl-N-acetylglucosaminyl-diphospho-decaprenol beta-1,3/1,4-galactofuranosyltransferase
MEKAIAVVVTYNRRQLLSECIQALRNQTRKLDAILVVNNGSTDTTQQWLQQQKDLFFVTQENVGSSGGFATAIKWAYDHGYSWIWCMDDDGYPREDALEKILYKADEPLMLRNCAVLNKEDKRSFVWNTKNYASIQEVKERVIEGVGHPFNGTMLHRRIVERVGYPKPKLFLWGDETEYFYRITRKNNIPVCTIADSIHYHPATAFSYKKDWDYQTSWKMYFYVRNRFHIHKAKFSNKAIALFNYLCFLVAFTGVIFYYQKTDRFKKLSFMFWPAADAFAQRFTAEPQIILTRLNKPEPMTAATYISDALKNVTTSLLAPFAALRYRRTANV